MNLFPLTNEERIRLQKLNLDKTAVFALKKLFMNIACKKPASNEAIEKITEAFHDFEIIQPENHAEERTINQV